MTWAADTRTAKRRLAKQQLLYTFFLPLKTDSTFLFHLYVPTVSIQNRSRDMNFLRLPNFCSTLFCGYAVSRMMTMATMAHSSWSQRKSLPLEPTDSNCPASWTIQQRLWSICHGAWVGPIVIYLDALDGLLNMAIHHDNTLYKAKKDTTNLKILFTEVHRSCANNRNYCWLQSSDQLSPICFWNHPQPLKQTTQHCHAVKKPLGGGVPDGIFWIWLLWDSVNVFSTNHRGHHDKKQ
jgi:hypothetical protein